MRRLSSEDVDIIDSLLERALPGSYGDVRIDSYAPEEIALTASVPAGGAILTGTERAAPGWRAWVDGAPVEPVRTNLFFRGLELPSGEHRVLWKYQPRWWWPLVCVSTATQALVVATALALRKRRAALL